jgi:acetolactate synthase-1/2/3 large subunit
MKASDLLVQCLEAEGVEYVFGLPGEENEDMLFSLRDSSIRFIPTRHEQGAAFMADAWGRLTGKAGVCLSTLGPGATNLLTGLADAALDKSPVVAITGQGSSQRLHKESHQAIDVVNIFRPIVRWNMSIQNPAVIPEAVRKAFKLSQMEKPGVTHLELPEDIARQPVSRVKPIVPQALRRPDPDEKALDKAAGIIAASKRPLILAGNGAIRKRAAKYLRALVEIMNVPVVATFMGKGAVSDADPHSLFAVGLKGKDVPFCAIERADCIIAVGYDIAEYDPESWNTKPSRPIVHIDFVPAEVYDKYQPAVEIAADASATLRHLIERLREKSLPPFSDWFMPVRRAVENDLFRYPPESGTALTVPWVLASLRRHMGEEDILISDVGAHKMWIGRNFPVYTPGTCIISNGFASMGIAVPGGVAAKLAFPKRRVVTVSGDGGFLMNSQEIETATRIGVGYTIIILNDNDYGLISWKQRARHPEPFGTALTNPDFVAYAKSFGVAAYHPKTRREVERVFSKALRSDKMNVISIDVDPKENVKLSQKFDQNLCPVFRWRDEGLGRSHMLGIPKS